MSHGQKHGPGESVFYSDIMNAQSKNQLVSEIIDDLEAEQGSALPLAQRQEVADVLRDYLKSMEEYISKHRKDLT